MQLLSFPPDRGLSRSRPGVPDFEIDARLEKDVFVIRASGELDLFDRPRLEGALRAGEASRASRVVVDLAGLTFIDAACLYALLAASRRSARRGYELSITPGKGEVARTFRLAGLDGSPVARH